MPIYIGERLRCKRNRLCKVCKAQRTKAKNEGTRAKNQGIRKKA